MSAHLGILRSAYGSLAGLALALTVTFGCSEADPIATARGMQGAGRYAASLPGLRDLIEAEPNNAEAHYLHGLALHRSGQPEPALWSLRKASEDPDWAVAAGLEFVASAIKALNYPAAIEAANKVLALDPENVLVIRLRAEAQFENKQFEEALADFEQVLESDPQSFEVQLSRVATLLGLERAEEAADALAAIEAAGEANPTALAGTGPSLCVVKISFAQERGEPAVAQSLVEDCFERFPNDASIIDEAIGFFDSTGNVNRSAEILRDVIERIPDAVAYRDVLAHRLRAGGRVPEAEEVLLGATRLESDRTKVAAWSSLTDHYMATKEFPRAAEALGKAIELESNPTPQRIVGYADLLAMVGEYDRALAIADEMDQEMFGDLVRGRVYLQKREPEKALDHLSKALLLWPNNFAARYYAARAAERIGDFDRAIEEYRASVRSNAAATDAGLRVARLYEALGAREEALAAVGHHLNGHPTDSEALLLMVRVNAQLGRRAAAAGTMARLRAPEAISRALAMQADAAAEQMGTEHAVAMLRANKRLDLRHPAAGEALRALIRHAAVGDAATVLALTKARAETHADFADVHAVYALALERFSSRDSARTPYQRALELEPEHVEALSALGRMHREAGDLAGALDYQRRAASAAPNLAGPALALAQSLVARAERDEALSILEEALWAHPSDARAALQLASLLAHEGGDPSRSLALAQQALRLGAGSEAEQLVARLRGTTP